jgi:ATP-dependent DNA helicase RecQ
MRDKPLTEREMGGQLIGETLAYAESSICRRRVLLHYFGEEYFQDKCNMCDNCLNPKEKIEVKDTVFSVLETIRQLKEMFAIDYVINVVLGRDNTQIQAYKHDRLKCFSMGAHFQMNDHFWYSLVRQMMVEGLIRKDIEEYGLLKLTDKGKAFLKKPYSLKLSLNHQFEDAEFDDDEFSSGSGEKGSSALDPALLAMLKELRKQVAHQNNVPPFVVFLENSLEEMATNYPTTLKELENISGVSKGKAMKYGKKFIELIGQYVEDNNIEKVDEFIMKSVVNKSGIKVFIIQNIDKKIPLETIAGMKNINMFELLDEMESIVSSGTRLSLDYCINDYVDPYDQEEMYDFLQASETGNIEEVFQEMNNENISIEQLRLMRIKFMSDYAN